MSAKTGLDYLVDLQAGANRLIRFLINEALVKVDDMPNEDAADEAIRIITKLLSDNAAKESRIAELEAAIKNAKLKLSATQRNWDEDCLFECNDILTTALNVCPSCTWRGDVTLVDGVCPYCDVDWRKLKASA